MRKIYIILAIVVTIIYVIVTIGAYYSFPNTFDDSKWIIFTGWAISMFSMGIYYKLSN